MGPERLNLAEAIVGDRGRASRVALRERDRAWTYGELADVVARVGGALAGLGVRAGDRVAVLMPDGLEAVAAILGAIRLGAIAVPMSELGRPNDIRALVCDAGAAVAIVHASLEPILDEVRRETPLREVIAVGGARGAEHDFAELVARATPAPTAPTAATDPALILYSAGVGDTPRGVVHTHAGPLESFLAYARGVLALDERDRVFSAVKLATAYGFGAGMVFPLLAGAEAVLLPEQPTTAAIVATLEACRPTILFATPSIYSQLLSDHGSGREPKSLSGLRACVSGAEGMPARLTDRVRARLGAQVLAGYGLTEAFHFVLATAEGGGRDGAAGRVVPGFEARVVDDDGRPVGPQEIGTLEVRGPSIAAGYWARPEETAAVFRGEWLHTGDRFLLDADGYFFHCGRADGLFKVSGHWVSPTEVEQALLRHEAVWESAVIGVDDENGLTKPLAFVVPNVGHPASPELERELIEYVKREIAPYKYPRWIEFVDALPKGSHGKVLRYKLHALPRRRRRSGTTPPAA